MQENNTLGIWGKTNNHEKYVGLKYVFFAQRYKDTPECCWTDIEPFTKSIPNMHHIKYFRFKVVPNRGNQEYATNILDTIIATGTVDQYFDHGQGGVYLGECVINQDERKRVTIRKEAVIQQWKWISNICKNNKSPPQKLVATKTLWDRLTTSGDDPIPYKYPLAYENTKTDFYSHMLVSLLSACPQFYIELMNECICEQCNSKQVSTKEIRTNRSWWSEIMKENKLTDTACANMDEFNKHFGYAIKDQQMDFFEFFITAFEFHDNVSNNSPQFKHFL